MVSRRRILSRSRDDLNLDSYVEEEEDIWYQKDKLFKDHIQEVLDKWEQIDDEIWAKVIVLERNRRVAKAYARAPVLTINGSDEGFDGFRIGLCGFDNPMRDAKTDDIKRHIGNGVKVKMDEAGNILVKRVAKANIFAKSSGDENALSSDILKLKDMALETDKPVKLFDIKKFQQNVMRELKRAYPDRRKLESQCIAAIAFVKNEPELLDCPIWVMIINIVAMEFLKARIPPVKRAVDIRNRPRIPIPDEDPYSVAGSGSAGSAGSSNSSGNGHSNSSGVPNGHGKDRKEKPPKLPPRDAAGYPQGIPKPDYDDITDDSRSPKDFKSSRSKEKPKDRKYDDPYYCGMRARIPNFVKGGRSSKEESGSRGGQILSPPNGRHIMPANVSGHPMIWHSRSIDSGMESDFNESLYSHIYGRFPLPGQHRPYAAPPAAPLMYVGEWE